MCGAEASTGVIIGKKYESDNGFKGPGKAKGDVGATPQQGDQAVIGASDEEVRRRRASTSNTNKTGATGDTSTAKVETKTLLGQ